MGDLFDDPGRKGQSDYSAKDIEVLEGLEPVRRRPGMYIGGTDERAMHHLVAELLDNAMDEAVAGHASRIELELDAEGFVTVTRQRPRHSRSTRTRRFKGKTALEVIDDHAAFRRQVFGGKVYKTSGGLHGVGLSVVNALPTRSRWRSRATACCGRRTMRAGKPTGKLKKVGPMHNRRGTTVRFHPDPEIFGKGAHFQPARLYRMARSKAYLFRGVEIRWRCEPEADRTGRPDAGRGGPAFRGRSRGLPGGDAGGPQDRDDPALRGHGRAFRTRAGRVEWAIAWPADGDGFCNSYCNTVPTPEGGTHEAGLRGGLARSLRAYGELVGNRKVAPGHGRGHAAAAPP